MLKSYRIYNQPDPEPPIRCEWATCAECGVRIDVDHDPKWRKWEEINGKNYCEICHEFQSPMPVDAADTDQGKILTVAACALILLFAVWGAWCAATWLLGTVQAWIATH